MRLQVKGRNLDVTDSIRSYAEQKLKKLDKQLNDATEIELELAVEKNPSISANHVAEATVWTKGPVLRAKEASSDMRASIDLLVDKLERQVSRYREKRQDRRHGDPHRNGGHEPVAAVGASGSRAGPQVGRAGRARGCRPAAARLACRVNPRV